MITLIGIFCLFNMALFNKFVLLSFQLALFYKNLVQSKFILYDFFLLICLAMAWLSFYRTIVQLGLQLKKKLNSALLRFYILILKLVFKNNCIGKNLNICAILSL